MGLINSLSKKQEENNEVKYQDLTDDNPKNVCENKLQTKTDDLDSNLKNNLTVFLNNIFVALSIIKKAIDIKNIKEKLNEKESILSKPNIFNSKSIIIIFLWLIWITNVSIFTNKDLIDLFFPDMTSIKYLLLLCSLFILFETSNIINGGYYRFHNIIFYIYFAILLIISFKSLLYNKQGWQFYLIIIIINLNLKILNLNN